MLKIPNIIIEHNSRKSKVLKSKAVAVIDVNYLIFVMCTSFLTQSNRKILLTRYIGKTLIDKGNYRF